MKFSKRLVNLFTIGLFSTFAASFVGLIALNHANNSHLKIKKITHQAGSLFDSLKVETLTFDINQEPNWKQTKTADQITPTELTQLLIPKLNGGIYFVTIIPPTSEQVLNGELHFLVTQNKPKFEMGRPSDSIDVELIEPTKATMGDNVTPKNPDMTAYQTTAAAEGAAAGSEAVSSLPAAMQQNGKINVFGKEVDKKYVWTTKNIANLILPKKFSFKWNTDAQIGAFLRTTIRTVETIRDEDIITNLVSTKDRSDFLPKETKATISYTGLDAEYGISENDAKAFGVAKVKIEFGNSEGNKQSNWVNSKKPENGEVTRLIRGLVSTTTNQKEILKLNVENFNNVEFDLAKVLNKNPVFSAPADVLKRLDNVPTNNLKENMYSFRLSELTPTQIINAIPNDSLVNLLATRSYLKSDQKLPPIFIQYMNKDAFNSTITSTSSPQNDAPFKGTGLEKINKLDVYENENSTEVKAKDLGHGNVANNLNIINIRAVGNDLTGKMDLEVNYSYYDVFDNKFILNKTALVELSGFATNKDFGKNLFFNWKQDTDLTYNSANFFMQQYETHKENAQYLKELTNEFFYATPAVYEKDRKVTINTLAENKVKITLEFEEFGGSFYVEDNKVHAGLKVEKTFSLSNNSPVANQIRFKFEQELKEQIPNYDQLSPSKLINLIAEKQLTDNNFFDPISSNEYTFHTLYQPISTNDGIKVTVAGVHNSDQSKNLYFTNYYFGLVAEAPTSTIFNLNFNENLVQNDEYRRLLRTPLQDVTVEDITNLYLKNLSLFKDFGATFTLDHSQVKITKDENAGTIKVDLTLNRFNTNAQTEGVNNQTTYSTILKGFISQNLIDANSKTAPVDLTIPLAAGLGVAVSVSLLAAALWSVYKRIELTKKSKIKI